MSGLHLGGNRPVRYGFGPAITQLVLALKLAELELGYASFWGEPPAAARLDVLAELDAQRQQLLLEAVGKAISA